jgi:hypothetical protein
MNSYHYLVETLYGEIALFQLLGLAHIMPRSQS